MKIRFNSKSGSVLLGSLVVIGLIGISLIAYLSLTASENTLIGRSQAWNMAIAVAEAGLEEAMTQLNFQQGTNLTANGWSYADGKYSKQRTLTDETYFVTSIATNDYTIETSGFVRAPLQTNYISRTIRATFDTANTIFTDAIIARKHVKIKSKDAADMLDSYDSGPRGWGNGNGLGWKPKTNSWSNGNTNNNGGGGSSSKKGGKSKGTAGTGTNSAGLPVDHGYVKQDHKDNAGVSVTSRKKKAIKIDRTDVYGTLRVAAGGKESMLEKVETKNGAAVGTLAWVDANNTGIQSGRLTDDFQYSFPDVEPPFIGGGLTPSGFKVNGKDYQYVLDTGNYEMSKVDLKSDPMLVRGHAVLYVNKDGFKATKDIIIEEGASLKLYVNGHFHFKGKAIANSDVVAAFQLYGLAKCKCVKIEKDSEFAGVIYAPRARVKLKSKNDMFGSIVAKCVHIDKESSFHYDEALMKLRGQFERFVIVSWREI